MSPAEQEVLEGIGRQLAKGTSRFGDTDANSTSSLIHCRRVDQAKASVRILDAVGMVATPTLQLQVAPKIPTNHLLYILQAGRVVPRLAGQVGYMAEADNLAVLIGSWFVSALERALEEGLSRDYRLLREETPAVRGRVALLDSARLYYRGRLAVVAEFEEFDFDTPLNRLLLQAARVVAGGRPLPQELRRRALRSVERMDGVGPFRRTDYGAAVDRRTAHYADAALLARQVLASTVRTLAGGPTRSWTFLFRTPGPVEAGIRAVLTSGLSPTSVRKRSIALAGSTMTINPDLVFDDAAAVGDFKYKVAPPEWNRADLYEVVAFSASIHTHKAAITTFRPSETGSLPDVTIGDYKVTEVTSLGLV